MRKNPYYRLQYISGIPYLLTFGQGNADFNHDMRLNDTGVFLWEQLGNASDIEALIALCAEHFHCPAEQYPSMAQAVGHFVATLRSKHIILPEVDDAKGMAPFTTLEIAGLFLKLYGAEAAFSKELLDFETSKGFSDDTPHMELGVVRGTPSHRENGTLLLRNDSLTVIEGQLEYILLFPTFESVSEARISKDGQNANIFCSPEFTDTAREEISYAIRILFLYFAQLQGMVALHSASLRYRDKVWLFSAASGTGKTTHVQLWQDHYNTPIINGDLNLIAFAETSPVVHGIPWCGTSGVYTKETYPLGGVIFLRQGEHNRVTELPKDLQQLYLLHRSISPAWTDVMQQHNLDLGVTLSGKILTCLLTCTKDADAAHCIRKRIDTYLDNN